MFILTKLFWYLLQPSSLVFLALLAAFAFAIRGRKTAAWRIMLPTCAVIGLFGIGPASDLVIVPLETRFPRPAMPADAKIAGLIMLGGAEDSSASRPRGAGMPVVMAVNEGGERVMETAALARRYPNAKVVISGGSGHVFRERTPEAEITADALEDLGIARSRMVLEGRSRTTFENAAETRTLLAQKPGERWLLITTAWHMPRSIATFRKAGISVEPWPVDYRTRGHFDLWRLNSNPFEGLRRLDFAAKEWVGLVGYRLTGRSDSLFPGP